MPRNTLLVMVGAASASVMLAGGVALAAVDDERTPRHQMTEMPGQMPGAAGMHDGTAGMHDGMAGMHEDMAEIHGAMSSADHDAMHALMREALPEELRDRADAMHDRMSAMRGNDEMRQRHADHHTDR
jgi:hypothetical protein